MRNSCLTALHKKALLLIALIIFFSQLDAQVTLTTPVPSGVVYVSDTDPGVLIFGVKNTNSSSIIITELASYLEPDGAGTYTLWYHPTEITGLPSAVTAANGWIQLSPGGTVTPTGNGVIPILSGLNLEIPANTTYRLALEGPVHGPYYGVSGSTSDLFSGGGLLIYAQGNPNSQTYAGIFPTLSSTFTPRSFYGSLTFVPMSACTDPPAAGNAVSSLTQVCTGQDFTLDLVGNSIGTGQTYQWQSSPDNTNWNNIGTLSSSPIFTTTLTGTTYYRCAVACGASTVYSTSVQVISPGSAVSGNFTINSGMPTGGNNFQTFGEAVNHLMCGISGPVVFTVAPGSGPYNEQVVIPSISGASATNTVTFKGNLATINYSSTTSTSRAGILLDGADHIIIDSLIIDGSAGTYAWGVVLTNQADSNIISHCTVNIGNLSSSSTNYIGMIINGSASSTATSGNNGNGNLFDGNTVNGGYYGIYVYGASSANNNGNMIKNNTVTDMYSYGIYNVYQSDLILSGNEIYRPTRSSLSTAYCIYLSTGCENALVEKNRIHNLFDGSSTSTSSCYSIYVSGDGTAGRENKIINNLIYNTGGNGTVYGIYNTTGEYMQAYHNTISLDDATATSGSAYGLYQTGTADGLDYRNNVVVISRSGTGTKRCIYFGSTGSTIISNNNVLYMNAASGTSNYLGQFGSTNYTTLADWQTANGGIYDLLSVSLDPLFVSPGAGDYTPSAVPINNIGDNIGVADDILGNPRMIASPDPGAYEFSIGACTNPPTPGAAISSAMDVCAGSSFTLDLSGNSVGDGQTYQWQSSSDNSNWTDMAPPATITAFLASQTVSTYYRCAVKCGSGGTVYSASVYVTSPLLVSGNFTINSGLPTGSGNFQTFTEAVNSLLCGIDGPVVFNVAFGSGPYNEQVTIPQINGTSAINTITFKGNLATLTYNSTTSTSRAGILLDGADHIIIDSLIVDGSAGTYAWGIVLTNQADSNVISHCTVNIGNLTSSSSNYIGMIINGSASSTATSGNNGNGNLFDGNTVNGGYYGIYVYGSSSANNTGNIVRNNKINDMYSYGIYNVYQSDLIISGNNISRPSRSSLSTAYCIYLSTGCENALIEKNRIHNLFDGATTSSSSCYAIYISGDGTAGRENKVINNLIYNTGGNGTVYGIYNTTGEFMQAYHNTISLDDVMATTGSAYGLYQTGTADGLDYRNNMVMISRSGTGTKRCIYFGSTGSTITSDHNILYMNAASGTNNNLGQFGSTDYAMLADWQTANGGIYDLQSVSVDPLFTNPGSGDYTPANSLANNRGEPVGVTTDINGAARNALTPDAGAYEFSTLTTGVNMGAEALVTPAVTDNGCYTSAEIITIRIRNNSTATIDFAVNPVTVTVNVSGAATQLLSKLLNSGTLASDATMDVQMTATLDMSAPGDYTFNAYTSVTGDVNPTNDAMLEVNRSKLILNAGTLSSLPGGYCITPGAPTLSTIGAEGYSSLQWQESVTAGSGFSNISAGITNPYTIASPISQTMYYRLVVSCGASTLTSPEITVALNNPQLLSSTPGTRCGPGTVVLGASVSTGATAQWYEAASGGSVIGTGTSFITPSINSTTTYYVAASGGSGALQYVGAPDLSIGSATNVSGYYLTFSVLSNTTIQSVECYFSGSVGSSFVLNIRDAATSSSVFTYPGTVTVSGTSTPQVIPINATLPPGDYEIGWTTDPGTYRTSTGAAYPYTLPGIISITGNTFNDANYYYYFYHWSVVTSCESPRTAVTATVEPAPMATISYPGSPFCNATGIANVSFNGTTGGTYSSTAGLVINSTTGAIDLDASSNGTYTVTYTVAASGACAQYQTTTDVIIGSAPVANIAYPATPYCSNAGIATIVQTGTPGGVYSSTAGLSINPASGDVNLAASTPGTYTVTYSIAASGACPAYQTTTDITISAAPSATISYPGSPFCNGAGTAIATQTGTSGGTYSSASGLSINSSTGTINLGASTTGTFIVTYTIAAANGCAQYQTTTAVTINSSPSATISYNGSPYCSDGGTATVTHTGSGGGTYSSTAGLSIDASTGAVNLGASTPGTYTVTYSIAAGGGCSAYQTTGSITITAAPSATISYTGSPYCSNGGTATVTQTGTTGGTYSSTTGLSIDATTGIVDLGASTPGTYTVTYTIAAANGCGQYQTTTDIIITVAPDATISYPASPYCSNAGIVTVTQAGTTGGIYSSSTGLSIDAATGTIDPAASTAGTYTVTYTIAAGNGCTQFQATTGITITAAPSATISYAGSPYCSNSGMAAVTQTGTTGGTYSSTTGLSIDAMTGTVDLSASTAGTYTVTYTIAAGNGCAQFQATTDIIITAAPSATISYPGSPFCISSSAIPVTQTGAGGGVYSSTTGLSIDAATGAIDPGASTPGTYTVTYTIAAAGGCAQFQATAIVTISPTGTWVGVTSSNWNDVSNWCGGLPGSTTDVVIPATAPNMPVLSAGTGMVRNISINTGATVTIGTDGVLNLYGNINGTGSFNATEGSISFRGATMQTVPGFAATNLTMDGSGGLMPLGNITVSGTLNLTDGNITLGSNNISLSNTAAGSTASHIITNGTGQVTATGLAAAETRTIPVGIDAASYNPVTLIANAGHVTDNISVRVQQGVYENGVSGLTYTTHVADRMWILDEDTPGGSNVNIILQWSGAEELPSFDRTRSYVMQYNGSEWVAGIPSSSSGTDPYTQTKVNVTSFSPFAVETQRIPRPAGGIYPNPTPDYLNVVTETLSQGPVNFSVYDAKGRLVYRRQVTLSGGLNQTTLDLRHLAEGIYILKVSTRLDREFLVQRFIKGN